MAPFFEHGNGGWFAAFLPATRMPLFHDLCVLDCVNPISARLLTPIIQELEPPFLKITF